MNLTTNLHNKTISIVDRAIKYIAATPPAISGANGHSQTFALASTLVHGFDLDGATVFSLLEAHHNPKCNPPWSESELEHKVREAEKTPSTKPRGWLLEVSDRRTQMPARLPSKKVTIPKVDPIENIQKFIGDFRCNEDDVRQASPYRIPRLIREEHFHRQGAMLIEYLFDKDDLVRVVRDSKKNKEGKWHPVGYGQTAPRADWARKLLAPLERRDGGCWFGMNPLDGKGVSDANVTAFRYALLEFDDVDLEFQLSLLAKLPLPIAAIIFSGRRSYHALVKVGASSIEQYKETVSALFERLHKIGADTKNKNASRMSRLPGFYREGQQQRLVYLNPEPSAKGIL